MISREGVQRNRRGLPESVAAFLSQGAAIQGVSRHVPDTGGTAVDIPFSRSCLIVNTLCLEESV